MKPKTSRADIATRVGPWTKARHDRRQQQNEAKRRRVRQVAPAKLGTAASALADSDPEVDVPLFDASMARTFSLMLQAGIPTPQIATYLLPTATPAVRDRTFTAWCASPLLLDAVNTLNGGEWHLLAKETRLQVAQDKTLAEMAHYLITHRFADDTSAKTVARMRECREAIRQAISGASGDAGDALDSFMRFLGKVVEGKADLGMAPQLYEVTVGTSIPVETVKES